jgi:membrane-bound ClpP family serine protease
MKRTVKDWILILASLLDDAAVVVIVLLVLWFLKVPISWPVIILLILLFVATIFIMHKLVIPALHRRKVTGSEGMLGLEGRVVKSLAPAGTISVKGEYWTAKSIDKHISVGEQVEIVGMDGLTLQVKRKE